MQLTRKYGRLFKLTLLAFSLCLLNVCVAQKTKQPVAVDTTMSDEELLNELDLLLDSIAAPKNVAIFNLAAGPSFLSYETRNNSRLVSKQKLNLAPSLAFFHKSGLGIAGGTSIISDSTGLNPYQY